MARSASYIILPELKLIIESFSGEIKKNDVIELKRKEVNDEKYDPDFNLIVSSTDLNIAEFSKSDVKNIAESINSDFKKINSRHTAVITATPQQVVAGTLFKHETADLPINLKIVSTVQAALNWVSLPPEYEATISEHISSLRSQTVLS